jgi:hypothetical protein
MCAYVCVYMRFITMYVCSAIDCTVEVKLCEELNIGYTPTVMVCNSVYAINCAIHVCMDLDVYAYE